MKWLEWPAIFKPKIAAPFTPPKPVTKPKDQPWVAELRKMIGAHEIKDNGWLRKWLNSDKKTLGDPAKLPWCGDAVETALKLAIPGVQLTADLKQNPYWARNWASFGVPAAHIPPGAIVSFTRPGGGGHVGFAVGRSADGKLIYVMGGNQSNTVSIAPIKADRLLAARWPHEVYVSPYKLPIMSGGGVSVNEA